MMLLTQVCVLPNMLLYYQERCLCSLTATVKWTRYGCSLCWCPSRNHGKQWFALSLTSSVLTRWPTALLQLSVEVLTGACTLNGILFLWQNWKVLREPLLQSSKISVKSQPFLGHRFPFENLMKAIDAIDPNLGVCTGAPTPTAMGHPWILGDEVINKLLECCATYRARCPLPRKDIHTQRSFFAHSVLLWRLFSFS